jgi:hypothetical protein
MACAWLVPRSSNELSPSPQDPPPDDGSITIPIRREALTTAVDGSPISTRSLLLAGFGVALALIGVMIALKFFLADDTPEMTEEAFQAALQQWESRGPANYDLDVEIGGARPGVAHVEVRNGVVTVATRDGLPLKEWNKDEWSIPGQFEALEREFEFQENPQSEMQAPPGAKVWLRCEFDPQYGFPRRFHRYATGGAPEVYWRNSFRPN